LAWLSTVVITGVKIGPRSDGYQRHGCHYLVVYRA